jgi:phenylalanyl-tRNA synthetase alpha chain
MERLNSFSNIPESVLNKIGRNLHLLENHPIEIVKRKIYEYFDSLPTYFEKFEDLEPYVSTVENFDKLLIGPDHVARSKSDTYYLNELEVLRTHTSAHQNQHLKDGHANFLVTGDVYRKDEIDATHYPIFYQMEGVGIVDEDKNANEELFKILKGLVEHLFPGKKYRINDDYFPFTDPSFEIEVFFPEKNDWLEILGCGIVHEKILKNNNLEGKKFWAFGLGLERLAMLLFDIPDIRYFWSTHERFVNQFTSGQIVKFKQFSTLPEIQNDISFWIPADKIYKIDKSESIEDAGKLRWKEDNDFFELVRNVGGDWISSVDLMDEFYHPKKQKHSRMYRITYLPLDPNLKDGSVFKEKCVFIQDQIRHKVQAKLDIELR